jgi:hypothetical protein
MGGAAGANGAAVVTTDGAGITVGLGRTAGMPGEAGEDDG